MKLLLTSDSWVNGVKMAPLTYIRNIVNEITEAVVQRCSLKVSVLKNLAKFIGKHLCQSLFFNKVAGLGLQLYYIRDSDTGVFL